MTTAIIGGIIIVYAYVVIRKKVKDIKKGKFCSCGCSDCSASCSKEK